MKRLFILLPLLLLSACVTVGTCKARQAAAVAAVQTQLRRDCSQAMRSIAAACTQRPCVAPVAAKVQAPKTPSPVMAPKAPAPAPVRRVIPARLVPHFPIVAPKAKQGQKVMAPIKAPVTKAKPAVKVKVVPVAKPVVKVAPVAKKGCFGLK